MPNGVAVPRSQNFYEGSENVRRPVTPIQVLPYRKTSTLDNLYPTGNGMSSADRDRRMVGATRSPSGQSEDTFGKSLWLKNQEPISIYNKTFG